MSNRYEYVKFDTHALQRVRERLTSLKDYKSIENCLTDEKLLDITKHCVYASRYMHETKRVLVDAWVSKYKDSKFVVLVDNKKAEVFTVYLHSDHTGINTPFVNKLYDKVKHKITV